MDVGRQGDAKLIPIAHRSNRAGIRTSEENTLPAFRECLSKGWSVEIDIRRSDAGVFYISHDLSEPTEANRADLFFEILRAFPRTVLALNIKELGYEADLIRYLEIQRVTNQVFLFDMELLETEAGLAAKKFRQCHSQIALAARVSDRHEPLDRALNIESASIMWVDEFDRLWVTESDIQTMKQSGRKVYLVSPEIHGFSLQDMERRWEEGIRWGIDGICTDYPELLARKLTVFHS